MTQTQSAKPRNKAVIPMLSLVAIMLLAFLIHLVNADVVLKRRTRQRIDEGIISTKLVIDKRNEPTLGFDLQNATQESVGLNLPEKKSVVLVFAGQCTGCSSEAFTAWQNIATRQPDVTFVVVSDDTQKNISEFVQRSGYRLPIVCDDGKKLAKTLHVLWTPRVYHFDQDKKLTWFQQNAENDPEKIWAQIAR